jgi:phosphatidylglycerophosphatase A
VVVKHSAKSCLGRICAFLATLGPIGYLPAPGTCGSIAAIFLLWGVRGCEAHYGLSNLVITLLVMGLSFWIIEGALTVFYGKDPQQIVLDEVVGFFLAMYIFPFKPLYIVLTFILFRLFDIEKPFGIRALEDLPGAWGIIADDVAAGLMAGFFVSWLVFAFQKLGVGYGWL